VQKDLEGYKKRKANKELDKALAPLAAAEAMVASIRETYLADLMRAAFLAEKTDLLSTLYDAFASTLDNSLAINELREEALQVANALGLATSRVSDVISGFASLLNKVNLVLNRFAALQGYLSLAFGSGSGATEMDKGSSKLGTVVQGVGSVGSLLGVSAGFSLYVNLYLIPAATVATNAAARLVREHNHMLNRLDMANNNPDMVDWTVEPGGRAMWDFMVAVMGAGSPVEVPFPIPDAVGGYVVDEKERFESGTKEEVPTTGYWFWEEVDQEQLRVQSWVFRNRQSLWAMLYGSITPPV